MLAASVRAHILGEEGREATRRRKEGERTGHHLPSAQLAGSVSSLSSVRRAARSLLDELHEELVAQRRLRPGLAIFRKSSLRSKRFWFSLTKLLIISF